MTRKGLTTRDGVEASLNNSPIFGVVRTHSLEEASNQARQFMAGGIELIEITFTVPNATELVRKLLSERSETRPPWIGMGTVTSLERADEAVAAGAEFLVSPNTSSAVASVARRSDVYLVLGALTPTEIVTAIDIGADIVKVYPLPPIGGAEYLATVRQPLGDILMLAAGGFSVDEIPKYRAAGATAFGLGPTLLGGDEEETALRIQKALSLARGLEV
jgi:2-dehydro-3-deoxyphosphogluconate aldolase/(4S)-4-hydroxy-2-oxoglutarate aldolase